MSRQQKCGVASCPSHRAHWGRYCLRHRRRLAMYGSPYGRCLPRGELTSIARRVLKLFREHPQHPGLLLASKEIQALLDDSRKRVEDQELVTPDVRHMARLAAHDVGADHVLAMLAATAIFDQENPGSIPDRKALRYAAGRAVSSLVSRGTGKYRLTLGSRALSDIGSTLVDRYSPFVASVVSHHRDADRKVEKRRETLRHPFTTGSYPE